MHTWVVHLRFVIQQRYVFESVDDIAILIKRILRIIKNNLFQFSILSWGYISKIFKCDLGIKHWNVNKVVYFDRRKDELIQIFQVFIVHLMPKIKDLLAVIYFPALELVSCLTLLVKYQKEARICSSIYSLSYQIGPFLFSCITGIAKCYK